MLPKAETDSFNRLLVSLGVLLVGGAVAGPWLALRSIDVLRISESELAGLTPTAQETIRQRQDFVSALTPTIWWIAAGGLIVGMGLIVVGAVRLYPQQKLDDEQRRQTVEQGRRVLDDLGVRPATESEIEAEVERDIADEDGTSPQEQWKDLVAQPGTDSPVQPPRPQHQLHESEVLANRVLDRLELPNRTMMRSVRFSSMRFVTDAVVLVDGESTAVFVEVKVVRSTKAAIRQLDSAAAQVSQLLLAVRAHPGDLDAKALVVMVVIPDEEEGRVERVERLAASRRPDLGRVGIEVAVVSSSQIEQWMPIL